MIRHFNIIKFAEYTGVATLRYGYSITPLKLQKILYYQQAWHTALISPDEHTLETIFDEQPEAWVNGPVYPTVYHHYKEIVTCSTEEMTQNMFCSDEEFVQIENGMDFSPSEKELLESVIRLYGIKEQEKLVWMTHLETPWSEQRVNLKPFEKSNNKISFETMYWYYKTRYDANRNSRANV